MILLALDAAMAACSAAVLSDGRVIARRFEAMARGQSEALMPMLRDTMAAAGLRFSDLDALAVTVGPGAYTGVRIGLAAARGMALAGGLPLVGVTTFDAVARGVRDGSDLGGRTLVIALETKRTDIYVQCFSPDLVPLDEPAVRAPEETSLPDGPVAVAGDAADRLIASLGGGAAVRRMGSPRLDQPDAAQVARIAAERIAADPGALDRPPPRPLYLRPPSVTPAPGRGRLRPP